MSDNNNTNIEQNNENNTQESTPQQPTFILSPLEQQQLQRLKEENKNPYIFAINKKTKAINKKLSKLKKIEELHKSGKELNKTQLESYDRIKPLQKKLSHFEDLKKNYIQIAENQKKNDPSILLFSLIQAIAVESKAHNDKFALQHTRLTKFRDLLFQEATGFSDFQKSVDNSNSLLQRFVESSETIAFDEITFKQLRTDLLDTTLGINGMAQFEISKNKQLEKKRIKEQEELEKKQKELQAQNNKNRDNRNKGNNNRNRDNNRGDNRDNRDNRNKNRDNNRNRENNNRRQN
eukprot:TRINITY_DN463_c1_g1_i1.p1 TRINITY_DN463_c1_g1~~TRINITY_DN463_c1_g1_i1.p1  ORF type:complete len:292 (-),score=106.31 TRINITY_DN463_c1_g1_i1:68-943(-)